MDDDTRQLKFRVQRTISSGDSSVSLVAPPSNSPTSKEDAGLPAMIRSTCVWLCFGLIGWHYPRYLILTNQDIVAKAPPYQKTAAGDVILDFTLNEKVSDPPIIPSELLKWSGCYLPFLIPLLHALWTSRRMTKTACIHEVCTVIAAFSMAMGLSEGTTQMLKLWIQRRRPSFYDLCGFDPQTLTCTASPEYIREANFSFPSGHSSLSCCGMTFVVWYFLGKTKSRPRWMTFWIAVVPWGWAIFVAGSRFVDKWHHPSDIVAGLGLGFAASTVAYHIWYPPVWSSSAGIPRPLLDKMDPGSTGSKLPSFHE